MEKVEILPDGSIPQVECTSMGFNPGPLRPQGEFPAPVSCVLTNGHMPHCTNTKIDADIPYITHGNGERYITNIKDGTRIGYKYFAFTGDTELTLRYRGSGAGSFTVSTDRGELCTVSVTLAEDWTSACTGFTASGTEALYFDYHGEGAVELLAFSLK